MTEYLSVVATLPASCEDELPDRLAGAPILGCEVAAGEADRIVVTVYLAARAAGAVDAVEAVLLRAGAPSVVRGGVAEEDWLAEYRVLAQPFAVGERWWIDPHPDLPTPAPERRTRLALEPRAAFGSGSHESTRLILLELEGRDLDGVSVLDLGTGSGVLAMAAWTLGAREVIAVDNDPGAVWVAAQILRQQDRKIRPRLVVGSASCLGDHRFDLVLCNMLPEYFVPMLGDIAGAVDDSGEVVLSGILGVQEPALRRQVEDHGLAVLRERFDGEWLAMVVARRGGVERGRSAMPTSRESGA